MCGMFLIYSLRCEVQFDYGLRQYRSLPLERRPETFKSEKGKEIQVRRDVAQQNDKITRGGKVRYVAYMVSPARMPIIRRPYTKNLRKKYTRSK